jgi:hypothetical protein
MVTLSYCKSETLQNLIRTGLDVIGSCVRLLRKLSGRYGSYVDTLLRLRPVDVKVREIHGGPAPANVGWW